MVAFGGGLNSTAMLIIMRRLCIVPDLILFADTGGEKPETYLHINRMSVWCVGHGFPAIEVVGLKKSLEQDCLNRSALPSIAYRFKSCSQRWKLEPQDKFLNNWEPAKIAWKNGGKVTKYIGFDAGEPHRAKNYEDKKYDFRYLLIELERHREDCEEIAASEGFVSVAKSSCFFCPNMRKWEIVSLAKNHPDLFRRAVEMERKADLTTVKGLGRDWSWENFLKNDARQMKMDFQESENPMPCGCYDGGED